MKKFRVLLVEDDEAQREYLASRFKAKGFEVLEAPTGRIALELSRKTEIDVVISDYLMPDAVGADTGIEMLRELHDRQPKKPIVILTTGFPDLLPEHSFRAGITAIFCKPFDGHELVDMVMKRLAKITMGDPIPE
jgi:two-component system cell cycle sensor histidine kinase/response regulator CckA